MNTYIYILIKDRKVNVRKLQLRKKPGDIKYDKIRIP